MRYGPWSQSGPWLDRTRKVYACYMRSEIVLGDAAALLMVIGEAQCPQS